MTLAAQFPERVSCVSLYDAIARYRWAPDYPCGVTELEEAEIAARVRRSWGTSQWMDRRGRYAITAAADPMFARWALTWFRRGASPSAMAAQSDATSGCDVRHVLAHIRCPTLVVNHADVDDGRFLAEHIPGARYLELDDGCHVLFSSELESVVAALSELVNDGPVEPTRRVLTTLLFTDIVDSTTTVAAVGDRRWGVELDHHYDAVRRHIERFAGVEVKTLGDGVIATFDAPSRAVQCALAIQHDAHRRGMAVRAGVHTGEVERRGDDVLGVNVHVAQRLCAIAEGNEVVVSRHVVDLVAGSGLRFERRGERALRGLGPLDVHIALGPPTPAILGTNGHPDRS
jgi:class 3 adenylate cyclase